MINMGCSVRRYMRILHNQKAAIGIGAMIVFIAMVLVAGIAASVIIQTSTKLESQAFNTGFDTEREVSTGIAVETIEAQVLDAAGNKIDKLAIMVRSRAGSPDIDLAYVIVEISDGTNKHILNYSSQHFKASVATTGIFSTDAFASTMDKTTFGVIELKDSDESCSASTPIINRGDKVLITINATTVFGSIDVRKDIWGRIVPEHGAPGSIEFRTPGSFADTVLILQE